MTALQRSAPVADQHSDLHTDAQPGPQTKSPVVRQAVADTAPFALAVIPFSLAIGHASATAGLSGWEAMFGAVSLLAGSSQLAAIEIISTGGGVVLTAMVVTLINLRFVFYGAGVASWFAVLPLRQRLLLAIPIVDQSFILCQERFETETDPFWRRSYYLSASVALIAVFLVCQLVSFHLGASIPDAVGLHMAAPLAFVGMLAKAIPNTQTLMAAVVGGATTVLGASLFGAFALPVGVALGVAMAMRVRS